MMSDGDQRTERLFGRRVGVRGQEGDHGPRCLRDREETVAVGDFEVALCRVGEYGEGPDPAARYRLVAMAGPHWYVVGLETTSRHARELAGRMERPCARTHRLAMSRETRTASLTPELFRLTGRASVTASFLKVRWAPPGSEFKVGAEYDSPLDARHPRWVGEAELDADAERRARMYLLWHARAMDAEELVNGMYPQLDCDAADAVNGPVP